MTAMVFGLPGGAEWLLLLVIALLIFGGSRLAGLGRGAGQAIREFKEETRDLKKADEPAVIAPQAGQVGTSPQTQVEPDGIVTEPVRHDPPRA